MVIWKIALTKRALKDAKKISRAGLKNLDVGFRRLNPTYDLI